MADNSTILEISRIAITEDVVFILAFLIQYTTLAKWWRHAIGATLVVKDILLLLALGADGMMLFWPGMPPSWAPWLTLTLVSLIGPIIGWRIAAFASYHRRHREDNED